MKKVIRLTESDLERIIKKVINEQSKNRTQENGNPALPVLDGGVIYTSNIRNPGESYPTPPFLKSYIGLDVTAPYIPKVDDLLNPEKKRTTYKIVDLRASHTEAVENPKVEGYEGVAAELYTVGKGSANLNIYYSCNKKRWMLLAPSQIYHSEFSEKFYELGNAIQNKFCNSAYTLKGMDKDTFIKNRDFYKRS